MNTTLLGAFAGATKEIRLESIEKSVLDRFPGDIGTKNVNAVRRAYEEMEG
jgi:pyruvate ferredoxin oxidoreductase gamma subunit